MSADVHADCQWWPHRFRSAAMAVGAFLRVLTDGAPLRIACHLLASRALGQHATLHLFFPHCTIEISSAFTPLRMPLFVHTHMPSTHARMPARTQHSNEACPQVRRWPSEPMEWSVLKLHGQLMPACSTQVRMQHGLKLRLRHKMHRHAKMRCPSFPYTFDSILWTTSLQPDCCTCTYVEHGHQHTNARAGLAWLPQS